MQLQISGSKVTGAAMILQHKLCTVFTHSLNSASVLYFQCGVLYNIVLYWLELFYGF